MLSQQYSLLGFVINDTTGIAPDIAKGFMTEKDGIVYDQNGEPCNGFCRDYYDENEEVTRVLGRFKNGLPVETIVGFYENGVVRFVYVPYRRKYRHNDYRYNYCQYREYDRDGNRIKYTNDKKGVEIRYYADGSLLSKLRYNRKKSRSIRYEEYYAENKKKVVISDRNKFDYDENGRLRRSWKRKSEKYDNTPGTMVATFYFNEYDVLGDVSRSGKFYTNLYKHDQWLHVASEFPVCIEHVQSQDFKEVLYPKLGLKDEYRWDYVNEKTIIIRYRQQGAIWSEVSRRTLPRLANGE